MIHSKKTFTVLFTAALLLAPIAFVLLPSSGVVQAAGQSRAPNVIATTFAFIEGKTVLVQYSNIYFCNSAGPPTGPVGGPGVSPGPCAVGIDATKDPVPDVASNTLNVIVPAFLNPLCTLIGSTCLSADPAESVFNPALGDNVFAQCPDNPTTLTCPNHPNFLDLTPTTIAGVVPLPIHTHILNTSSGLTNQGGWWKLKVWLVLDPTIWPNPVTGACTGPGSCLTSISALISAASAGKAVGPVVTTIYLFFNVVGSNAK